MMEHRESYRQQQENELEVIQVNIIAISIIKKKREIKTNKNRSLLT